MAEERSLRKIFDFKCFFSKRNFFIISILLLINYYLSDHTLIGFFNQLIGWLIIPLLEKLLKYK